LVGERRHATTVPESQPFEVMQKSRFVTVTIWVVVIGMVLSLSFAVVGLFQ
jgi:hypothetical protein